MFLPPPPKVHAENGDMVDAGQQAMIDAGIFGPEGHPMSRPEATEAEATHRAIAIADQVSTGSSGGSCGRKRFFLVQTTPRHHHC